MNSHIQDPHRDISFTFDWFNCVVPVEDVYSFFSDLSELDPKFDLGNFFIDKSGLYSYSHKLFLSQHPSICFAYNPDLDLTDVSLITFYKGRIFKDTGELDIYSVSLPSAVRQCTNPGLFVSISGSGLRYLGDKLVKDLFKLLYDYDCKVSRLDIACDIKNKDNYIVPMCLSAFVSYKHPEMLHLFVDPDSDDFNKVTVQFSRFRDTSFRNNDNCKLLLNSYFDEKHTTTYNITVGNHGSSFGMLRIYDKYLQVMRSSDSIDTSLDGIDYWYRIECELHKVHANSLFYSIVRDGLPIACAFGSAFMEMFRVCTVMSDGYKIDAYPSTDDYLRFTNWLRENAHFVQFITERFVNNSIEKLQKYMLHTSTFLYNAFLIFEASPQLKDEIFERAQIKRSHTRKFAYVDEFCDKLKAMLTAEA